MWSEFSLYWTTSGSQMEYASMFVWAYGKGGPTNHIYFKFHET